MYKSLTSSNSKGHKLRRKPNKQQIRENDSSKFVTRNRLSNHLGLFSRGKSCETVVRDPLFKEDIRARAEVNLSKILQLARAGSSLDNISSGQVNNEITSIIASSQINDADKIPVKQKKRQKQLDCGYTSLENYRDSKNFKEAFKSGSSKKKNIASSENSPSSTEDSSLIAADVENHSNEKNNLRSDQIEKTSHCTEQDTLLLSTLITAEEDFPYEEYAFSIKQNLAEACDALNSKYDFDLLSDLKNLLQDTMKNRQLQLTPPSGGKGISQYLENFDQSDIKHNCSPKKSETLFPSSSSSAITPNFGVVSSPLSPTSPQGILRRYERKLAKYTSIDDNALCIQAKKRAPTESWNVNQQKYENIFALNPEFYKKGSENNETNKKELKLPFTPTTLRLKQVEIPKTTVIDPIQYLVRYEQSAEDNASSKSAVERGINFKTPLIDDYKENMIQPLPFNTMSRDSYNETVTKKNPLASLPSFSNSNTSHNESIRQNINERVSPYPNCQFTTGNYPDYFPSSHNVFMSDSCKNNLQYDKERDLSQQSHQFVPNETCIYTTHIRPMFQQNLRPCQSTHLRFSQIIKSREDLSPELFASARPYHTSRYDYEISQTPVPILRSHGVSSEYPLEHLVKNPNCTHNFPRRTSVHDFNNPHHLTVHNSNNPHHPGAFNSNNAHHLSRHESNNLHLPSLHDSNNPHRCYQNESQMFPPLVQQDNQLISHHSKFKHYACSNDDYVRSNQLQVCSQSGLSPSQPNRPSFSADDLSLCASRSNDFHHSNRDDCHHLPRNANFFNGIIDFGSQFERENS